MSATVAMSGEDTVILNGRVITDLADGDVAVLTFPNNIAEVRTGKNGNSIYALNEQGKNAELVLRVVRASSDDKFLNGLINNQQQNFAGTVLVVGEFVKRIGDAQGNVAGDTYIASGGIFMKLIEAKSNVEGNTDQSISEYRIKFSNVARVIT